METLNIEGLSLSPLKQITDTRGALLHYLKKSDTLFNGFAEAYYSKINSGIVKGWKRHHRIHQHFTVPHGTVKMVVYDNRPDSPSHGIVEEIVLDDSSNYRLLVMPPMLWYSFKCESEHTAILANIITEMHDASESDNLPLDNTEIPYHWK